MAAFDLSLLETERRHAALLQLFKEAQEECLRKYASRFIGSGPQSCHGHLEDFEQRLRNCLAYTATGGKALRGVLCADSFLNILRHLYPGMLEDPSECPRAIETALDLAYCMEILQAAFLVSDDIVDRAATRRGRPAWRKVVGDDAAIVDSLTLLTLADQIALALDRTCRAEGEVMDIYESAKRRTIYGQHLDTSLSVRGRAEQSRMSSKLSAAPATPEGLPAHAVASPASSLLDADQTTMHEIHLNKTAYYTFVLPVIMGYRAGVFYGSAVLRGLYSATGAKLEPSPSFSALQAVRPDPQLEKQLVEACVSLGLLFQVQDDYLDVFAPEFLHKECSDIGEGKVSWVLVRALDLARSALEEGSGAATSAAESEGEKAAHLSKERASELLSFITLNYGRKGLDSAAVEGVREAFRGLGVVEAYRTEASSLLKGCQLLVDALPQGVGGIFGPIMGQLQARCQQ